VEISSVTVLWYVAFVASTTVHEASHALAAYVGGDPTAYRAGQVSLSPVPHMKREPFGMILLPIFSAISYGWALGFASTPYDPHWEARYPRRAAWMAAAGPAANLLLAAISLALLRVGLEGGVFYAPDSVNLSRLVAGAGALTDSVGVPLSILLVLDVILFLFNLIPFPPLDGATAITLLLPNDLALRFRETVRTGGIAVVGLLGAWLLFGQIVGGVFARLVVLVHPDLRYW
jgi:Zn-dependent protease